MRNNIIKGVGIHHIAVQARDWEQSRHFYEEILGMHLVTEYETSTEKFAFFDIGNGSYIELFHPTANTPASNSPVANDPLTHFALTLSNIHEVLRRIRDAGFKVTDEPFVITIDTWDATIAFVQGPNGENIELFQLNRIVQE